MGAKYFSQTEKQEDALQLNEVQIQGAFFNCEKTLKAIKQSAVILCSLTDLETRCDYLPAGAALMSSNWQ